VRQVEDREYTGMGRARFRVCKHNWISTSLTDQVLKGKKKTSRWGKMPGGLTNRYIGIGKKRRILQKFHQSEREKKILKGRKKKRSCEISPSAYLP